jgi:hypothetical protein
MDVEAMTLHELEEQKRNLIRDSENSDNNFLTKEYSEELKKIENEINKLNNPS